MTWLAPFLLAKHRHVTAMRKFHANCGIYAGFVRPSKADTFVEQEIDLLSALVMTAAPEAERLFLQYVAGGKLQQTVAACQALDRPYIMAPWHDMFLCRCLEDRREVRDIILEIPNEFSYVFLLDDDTLVPFRVCDVAAESIVARHQLPHDSFFWNGSRSLLDVQIDNLRRRFCK